MKGRGYVNRFIGGCIVWAIVGADAEPPVSPEYAAATKRFHRICDTLDSDHVGELGRRSAIQHEAEWTKGRMLKAAHDWCRERGILLEYQRCVSAIVGLTLTHKHSLPPSSLPIVELPTLSDEEMRYIWKVYAKVLVQLRRPRRRVDSARAHHASLVKRIAPKRGIRKALAELEFAERQYELVKFNVPTLQFSVNKKAFGVLGYATVGQILGPDKMIVYAGELNERAVFVDGITTRLLVDGEEYNFPDFVESAGTYTFITVLGAQRTIVRAERRDINLARIRQWIRAWIESSGL